MFQPDVSYITKYQGMGTSEQSYQTYGSCSRHSDKTVEMMRLQVCKCLRSDRYKCSKTWTNKADEEYSHENTEKIACNNILFGRASSSSDYTDGAFSVNCACTHIHTAYSTMYVAFQNTASVKGTARTSRLITAKQHKSHGLKFPDCKRQIPT